MTIDPRNASNTSSTSADGLLSLPATRQQATQQQALVGDAPYRQSEDLCSCPSCFPGFD